MATTNKVVGNRLYDAIGNWIGMLGLSGQENTLPAAFNQAAAAITGGTINGTSIGATTPAAVKTSNLQATSGDISGVPGNGTVSAPSGRAAFAAAGSSVVITNTLVTAASRVLVQLGGSDATLTSVRVVAGAGSFTVTGNAAATGITPFDFLVVN